LEDAGEIKGIRFNGIGLKGLFVQDMGIRI
jgi:hypothetical protein